MRRIEGVFISEGEALLYVYWKKTGWLVFRQVCRMLFSNQPPDAVWFHIWCAKNITSSLHHGSENAWSECNIKTLHDTKIIRQLKDEGLSINFMESIRVIDLPSVRAFASMLNPTTSMLLEAIRSIAGKNADRARRAVSTKDRYQVLISQGCKCALCPEFIGHDQPFEVDHNVQVSEGGSSARDNLQALCLVCHRKKTDSERSAPFV